MNTAVDSRLLPTILRHVNTAQQRVRPDGDAAAALDRARDHIADVAARRVQIENKVRCIQASATRGRGMSRDQLDAALEDLVAALRGL